MEEDGVYIQEKVCYAKIVQEDGRNIEYVAVECALRLLKHL